MHWKDYRLARTRVATGDAGGGPHRVLELLDGRMLIERNGAPAQIVGVTFDEAKALCLALVPGTAGTAAHLPWWRRLFRWLGGAS